MTRCWSIETVSKVYALRQRYYRWSDPQKATGEVLKTNIKPDRKIEMENTMGSFNDKAGLPPALQAFQFALFDNDYRQHEFHACDKIYMKFDHSEPDFSIVIFWVLDLKKRFG